MTLFKRAARLAREPESVTPPMPEYEICGFAQHEMQRLAEEKPASRIPEAVDPRDACDQDAERA